MKHNHNNRQAQVSIPEIVREERAQRGRVPDVARPQAEPQMVKWDITGRLRCPDCGRFGLRRDGRYNKDGTAPLLCMQCGGRYLLAHSIAAKRA